MNHGAWYIQHQERTQHPSLVLSKHVGAEDISSGPVIGQAWVPSSPRVAMLLGMVNEDTRKH